MKMNFIFKLFCLHNLLVLSSGLKYSQTCKAGVPWSVYSPITGSLSGLRLPEELRGEGGRQLQLEPAGQDAGGGGCGG